MLRYIVIRLFFMIVTLFIIVSIIHFVGDMVMMAKWSMPHPFSEDVALAWEHYKIFLKNVISDWNFGTSDIFKIPAWGLVVSKMPITIVMNLAAYWFYVTFGLVIGILSAVYKDSIFDKIVVNVVLVISSIPIYIMIIGLILFFGYYLKILAPIYPQVGEGLLNQLTGLIIPVLALSFWPLANIIRLTRAEVIDEMNEDFVSMLRAKGLNRRQIIFRHILRHILTTIIPELTTTFVIVLSFSFFVEIV
ncbi:MAG: ABC transporter permease, partial [Candidatus Izimaplasma sp.]|nr:ABC transporter permease [Candidatus Izimaplasma bacterium]